MKVRFLAADSFGVRSMATLVETGDVRMGIDLWSSFAPKRYGLPPHPVEVLALEASRKFLQEAGKSVDLHVITHYHFDHYCPDCEHYVGKRILGKDWRENINRSQRRRFSAFKWKEAVEPADGRKLRLGGTLVEFSPPFPHGEPNTRLGYVIMVYVEEDLGFLYTSDVEGPVVEEAVEWILEREPDIVYVDGPMDYLKHYAVKGEHVEAAWKNLERIADVVDTVVVDHHAARDLTFFERIREMGLTTTSEYHFGDDLPLEALRRDLWKGLEVSTEEVARRYKP